MNSFIIIIIIFKSGKSLSISTQRTLLKCLIEIVRLNCYYFGEWCGANFYLCTRNDCVRCVCVFVYLFVRCNNGRRWQMMFSNYLLSSFSDEMPLQMNFLRVILSNNFKTYGFSLQLHRRSPHAFMNNVWFKHGSSRIYCFIWFKAWIEWIQTNSFIK